jgi:endonuclease/exonuclease/phosphatase family metal-dependent hydrolase
MSDNRKVCSFMKKYTKLAGVAILYIALVSMNAGAQYTSQVKIMTYNINAQGHGSGSYSDIAAVIKEIKPDICGMQKLDSVNTRNSQYVLKWLSEQTSMPNFEYQSALRNYLSGSYGVGFLANQAPLSTRRLWIQKTSSEEDRGVLEMGITIDGTPARVIVTHLAHEGATYRSSQIQKILSWVDSVSSTDPVLIMADFNADSTESSMQLFTKAGYEYVRGKNGVRLDTTQNINHMLYRPKNKWIVVDAANPVYAASNRNPVWATMKLAASPVRENLKSQKKNSTFKQWAECNTVHFEMTERSEVTMSLYNIEGKKILTLLNNQTVDAGKHSLPVNTDGIKCGMYVVKTSFSGFKTSSEIVITD